MRQPVAPSRWKRAVRRFPAGQKVHRARGDLPAARRPQHRLDQAPDFFAAPEAAPPRAAVPGVERLAEAALAEGDGRAERPFSSLLREAPALPGRCQCTWACCRGGAAGALGRRAAGPGRARRPPPVERRAGGGGRLPGR